MPALDYAKLQRTVSGVMAKVKQGEVVLTRPGTSVAGTNEWDPPTVSDPVEYELDGAAKGVSEDFVDGTTILATDLEIICSVPSITPSMETDTLTVDGKGVTLLRIDRIPPVGTPVAFRLFVRA